MESHEVATTAGMIRGAFDDLIWSFKGIPYGADTGGRGRFRPPRPPTSWSGVRSCVDYGPSCPQMTIEQMLGVAPSALAEEYMGVLNTEVAVSEDCLVLNVWTPGLDAAAAKPVLVWLHGGGWSTGSASWPLYDFTNFARNRDAVVVGINHRLGILGFLDLSSHGDGYADSGNVGMLDVVACLEWVRDNIAGFGGDPRNVTVFGESGGGAKTSTLLAMPAAAGLFHKAFDMSGVSVCAQQPERSAENAAVVLDRLGLAGNVDRIHELPVEQLIEAEVDLPGRNRTVMGRGSGFSPALGPSLPTDPDAAVREGASRDVILVTGCTTDEVLAFLGADPDLWSLDDDGARARLVPLLGTDTVTVYDRYRTLHPDDSPTSLLLAIATDGIFRIAHVRQAEAKAAAGGAPAYLYAFAFGQPDPAGRNRAVHGLDMPYAFDNVDIAPIAAGPHAAPLVEAMAGALASLAHTGSPGAPGLPEWPAYEPTERATMRVDVESTVVADFLGAERKCWDGIDIVGSTHT